MAATLDADWIGRALERTLARDDGAWAELFLEARAVHRISTGRTREETALDSGGAIRVLGGSAASRQVSVSGAWPDCVDLLTRRLFDGGHQTRETGEPDRILTEVAAGAAEEGRRLSGYLAELEGHLERCIPPGASVSLEAEASIQRIRHQSTRSQQVTDTRTGILIRVTPVHRGRPLPSFVLASGSVAELHRRRPAEECARRFAEAASLEFEGLAWGPAPEYETSVVLCPGTAGLLFHETVGHLLQGDMSAPLREAGGDLSPLLTVVEHSPGVSGRGGYRVDDEGVEPRTVSLVEGGRVTGFVGARRRDGSPAGSTGSGRRQSFRDPASARLAATIVSAGQDDPEEIVSSTKKGILVQEVRSGSVDPVSGEFVLHAAHGRMIEHGRPAGATGEFLILGTVPNSLRTIDRIAHDIGDDGGASSCVHHGQAVPVIVGLPTLRMVTIKVRSLEMVRA